jgi:glycosyltransferase involved in cell wall biosynthesis
MGMITELLTRGVAQQDRSHEASPHVLLVVDQFPEILGGGERIVLKLASLLPEYGYRASILTFSVHPKSLVFESAPCPLYLLPLQRTYDIQAVRAAIQLKKFIEREKVEIVQTFFESSDIWAGFITKAMSQARLIWSRRDMGILRDRKHQIAYRLMRNIPDAVFAVSEQVRQHCIEVDRIDPARVSTIYNGLELTEWTNALKPAKACGELLITTVGNIRRVKGHDIFIRAAAKVVSLFPRVTFSIAGDVLEQDYFAQLQTLIRDLNLSKHFHFAGGVKDLRAYLSTADIFVLPSRSEGFSNALVEAMAASLPIVATAVGGNAEAVEDGVNGFIVPSGDATELANAIVRLISDPAAARSMGIAGREIAARRFTTEAMMNQITKIYHDLLVS